MLIEGNFDVVPDTIPKIGAGIYDFRIDDITIQDPKPKTDGSLPALGKSIVVKLTITQDGPNKDRQMTDYIWLSQDPNQSAENKTRSLVSFKRLALAAGVPITPAGINLMDCIGKTVKGMVESSTWTPPGGYMKETSKIVKYFIPGDAEMSTAPQGPQA